MYRCKFSKVRFSEFRQFCSHVKIHQHTANYRFACGIEQCPASFRTLSGPMCTEITTSADLKLNKHTFLVILLGGLKHVPMWQKIFQHYALT